MTRRNFLQISISAVTASALNGCSLDSEKSKYHIDTDWKYKSLLPELFETTPQLPAHVPIAIIGSGFGGSVSALRLSEAGKEVAVIERGNRWPTSKRRKIFAHDMFPDGRCFWHRERSIFPALPYDVSNIFNLKITHTPIKKFSGVLDIIEMDNGKSNEVGGFNLLLGTGVGGGSLIYTGVKAIPIKSYFEKLYPEEIDYDEMLQVYFPKVQNMLGYSYMPSDIFNSTPFNHCRDWNSEVRRAGYTPELIYSNFNWDIVRDELHWRSLPSSTLGLSNFGNSNGSKNDLRQNYIPAAEATGKTTIYHNQEVKDIRQTESGFELDIVQYNAFAEVIKEHTMTCNKLIMGAGSYHTTRMMVNAKATGKIKNLNEYVGRNWGDNHSKMSFRQGKGWDAFPRLGPQAQPSPTSIYDDTEAVPTVLENWANASLFEVGTSMFLSVGVDTDRNNRGHFSYDKTTQDSILSYPVKMRLPATHSVRNINQKIANANNQKIGSPGVQDVIDAGAHPIGGMEIGKATDLHGRVKGVDNLYVMDGALIPGNNAGANPSLMIAALAEKNIAQLLQDGDFD